MRERDLECIAAAKRKVISSISIWEIGLKVKQGKLEIPPQIGGYVHGYNTRNAG
jgi:PIN domain nuclease of toxin-antitoxin system